MAAGAGLGGIVGGILASVYCIVAGGLGLSGIAQNFFISSTTSLVAIVFGLVSLVLMIVLSRHYSDFLYLVGRNLAIVFAVVLVILFFAEGGQPGLQQILRLVLQLAIVWIIFSTFMHLRRRQQ